MRPRNFVRHRKTLRERTLDTLERFAITRYINARKDRNMHLNKFLQIVSIWWCFKTTRYLKSRTNNIFRSTVYRDRVLVDGNGSFFQDTFRMSYEQFNYIVNIIKDSPVFQKTGRKNQKPVSIQLKVALHRLCHDGSLSSYKAIARIMGITEGTAFMYTRRCIDALCGHIERFTAWPSEAKKREILEYFEEEKGLLHVLGAIDGTLIPLYRAPTLDRHSWATRKSNFAMGATGVCDHQGAFIYFSTGYPGSRHDSAAYKDTFLYSNPGKYFKGEECMVGDLAYGLSPTLITGFKGDLSAEKTRFNKTLSGGRSRIEHSFGMLKGRFRSLTCLRSYLQSKEDVDSAVMHISACVVMHNILTRSGLRDLYAEEFDEEFVANDVGEERDETAAVESTSCERVVIDGDGVYTKKQLDKLREDGVKKQKKLMDHILRL